MRGVAGEDKEINLSGFPQLARSSASGQVKMEGSLNRLSAANQKSACVCWSAALQTYLRETMF